MRRFIGCLATLLTVQSVAAAETERTWDRFNFRAGGYVASLNTGARIGTPGVGVDIDVEDVLRLDSTDSAVRLDTLWRFGDSRRHALSATWFDFGREGRVDLTEEIDIGGVVYPIGTTVESTFDLAFFNTRYSYSFLQDDRVDFSFSAGLHVTDLGLEVRAASVGEAGDAVTAPLPLIGIGLQVVLTPRWTFSSSVEGLFLKFEGYRGSVTDILTGVEYAPFRHFSFGGGMNAVGLRIESESEDPGLSFSGEVDTRFVGLTLYAKYRL